MSSVYAASRNPSRRAKQTNPLILPMPSSASPHQSTTTTTTTVTSSDALPARRGRKPGTLSRSARETQRKLNHSIIEKARRTKINDALASLKVLVPHNYDPAGTTVVDQEPSEDEADDDDDDDDDKDGDYGRTAGRTKAGGGKKQTASKEPKEFKLEILVRTVAYMQFLLKRVGELEEGIRLKEQQQECCKTCIERDEQESKKDRATDKKRKRTVLDEDESVDVFDEPRRKVSPSPRRERLPSISSWLPNCLPPSPPFHSTHQAASVSPYYPGYLPSPPASSQFPSTAPLPLQIPPALSLGPSAKAPESAPSSSSSPHSPHAQPRTRTPEEESAATLLLHMSSSPVFVSHSGPPGDAQGSPSPVVKSPRSRHEQSIDRERAETMLPPLPPPPSPPSLAGGGLDAHLLALALSPNLVAQTPSSILGLKKRIVEEADRLMS